MQGKKGYGRNNSQANPAVGTLSRTVNHQSHYPITRMPGGVKRAQGQRFRPFSCLFVDGTHVSSAQLSISKPKVYLNEPSNS